MQVDDDTSGKITWNHVVFVIQPVFRFRRSWISDLWCYIPVIGLHGGWVRNLNRKVYQNASYERGNRCNLPFHAHPRFLA